MSRKRLNPPRDAKERIEKYTAQHCNAKAIAKMFHVSPPIFYRWLREHPELEEARDAALAIEEKQLVDALWEKVKEGDKTAMIFLLKARHGYRDNSEVPVSNAVQVNLSLPRAIPLAEYKAQIAAAHPELVKELEHDEAQEEDGRSIGVDRA